MVMTYLGTLNPHERHMIASALRVAAEVYRKDAETIAKEFGEGGRTHKQFVSQAESAEGWAELIGEHDELSIDVRKAHSHSQASDY